jgi:integrase/recombinase XerC
MIDSYCKAAGINRKMSSHRLRHSSITHALEVTDGNVRKVQKLSRHAKIETLMIYDDARENLQGELSNLLLDSLED